MLLDLSEILSVPKKTISLSIPIELSAIEFNGNTYNVVKKSNLEVTLTNVGKRKFDFISEFNLSINMQCDRCLKKICRDFNIKFDKIINFAASDADEIEELKDLNYLSIKDKTIDTETFIANEVILALPMKVVCKKNCKGICPKCGINLNENECKCSCDDTTIDPRMSAFLDVFKQI